MTAAAPETSNNTEVGLTQSQNGEVEKIEETVELDPGWAGPRIEYKGDKLAVRYASMQALMAYQLSSGKFIPMEKQNDASGLFIDQHIGPDSYDRIMWRMMDPNDPDYTMRSFAEIMGELVRESVAKIKADREAEEATKKAAQESTTTG